MCAKRAGGEEAEPGPLAVRPNQVGVDGIGDGVGDAAFQRVVIEDDDLCEAPFEDVAADAVEHVDALGGVAEQVLHEGRDLSELIFDDEVQVVAHLTDRDQAYTGELPLCLGEPEAEDRPSLVVGQEPELGALAADGDVEELTGLVASWSSHARRKCTSRSMKAA